MGNINLTKDTTYRGRFQIDAPSMFVTENKVRDALQGQGFRDVQVWLDGGSLPADWPAAARAEVGGVTAWVEGAWSKDSGSYPSSGDRWVVIDYWIQKPAPGTCNLEGWTCYMTPCCEGFTCKPDPDRKYGDPGPAFGDPPSRCFPNEGGAITKANEPEPTSNVGWWLLGLGVVSVVGYFAWPSIAGAFSDGRRVARANPAGGGTPSVVRLNAGNDVNGNPRRLFLVFDGEGIIAAVDEGYSGEGALTRAFGPATGKDLIAKYHRGGTLVTTPAEYRALRKNFPASSAQFRSSGGDSTAVLHLRASNDANGNPRRVFVVFQNGEMVKAIDEGYSGIGALPKEWRDKVAAQIDTTPVERRALLRGA